MPDLHRPTTPVTPARPVIVWFALIAAGPELLFGGLGLVTRLDEYLEFGLPPNPAAVALATVAVGTGISMITLGAAGRGLRVARTLSVLLCVLIVVYAVYPFDQPMMVGGPMPPDPHGYVSIFLRLLVLPAFLLLLAPLTAALFSSSVARWCASRPGPADVRGLTDGS